MCSKFETSVFFSDLFTFAQQEIICRNPFRDLWSYWTQNCPIIIACYCSNHIAIKLFYVWSLLMSAHHNGNHRQQRRQNGSRCCMIEVIHMQLNWTPITWRHTKIFANNPKGLRQIRDHVRKALGKKNPDLLGTFCVVHAWPYSLKQLFK